MSIPIGTVCPFSGQVDPVSSPRNDVWGTSSCSGKEAAPAKPDPGAPLNYLEAQGWMLCDGRWLGTASYPELFAVLGGLYGSSSDSGKASFRIPDCRGLFLRGFDAGSGRDPDAGERLAPTGSSTLNVVGSLQCDALQDHTHNYDVVQPSGISQQGQAAGTTITSKATSSPDAPARVSTETRVRNIAVNYIIKFR